MITDVLREWVRYLDDNPHLGSLTDFGKQGIVNLADRIDEQHRRALEKVAAMVDEHDAGWAGWSGCRSCKAHKRGGVVECQAYANMFRLDRLEQHDIEAALRISELFVRVEQMERKLNHKGGAE